MNTTETNEVAAKGQEDWQNHPGVEGSKAFNEVNEQVYKEDLAKGIKPDGSEVEEKKLTPEEQQKKDEEDLKAFVADPQNKQRALGLAEQIKELCPKWFSIEMICKKSGESPESAFQKLKLVELFGLLSTRIGDHNDDRLWLRKPVYKIVISAQDQIDGLNRIIQYHLAQAEKFKLEVKLLQDNLAKREKKDPEN